MHFTLIYPAEWRKFLRDRSLTAVIIYLIRRLGPGLPYSSHLIFFLPHLKSNPLNYEGHCITFDDSVPRPSSPGVWL